MPCYGDALVCSQLRDITDKYSGEGCMVVYGSGGAGGLFMVVGSGGAGGVCDVDCMRPRI